MNKRLRHMQDFLEHIYQELETNPDFKGQL